MEKVFEHAPTVPYSPYLMTFEMLFCCWTVTRCIWRPFKKNCSWVVVQQLHSLRKRERDRQRLGHESVACSRCVFAFFGGKNFNRIRSRTHPIVCQLLSAEPVIPWARWRCTQSSPWGWDTVTSLVSIFSERHSFSRLRTQYQKLWREGHDIIVNFTILLISSWEFFM